MNDISQEALVALGLFRLKPRSKIFRLNPRSKKGLQQIQQHLVEVAMYSNPTARSQTQILNECSKLLGQPSVISDKECREALNSCRKSGRVEETSKDEYALSQQVVNELLRRNKEFFDAEKSFRDALAERVGKVLKIVVSPLAEPLLFIAVRDTIQKIFYDNATRMKSLLSSKEDVILEIGEDSNIDIYLRDKLRPLPAIQREANVEYVMEGIKLFLGSLNTSQRQYIGILHRRVFYFQILNMARHPPDVQEQPFEYIYIP